MTVDAMGCQRAIAQQNLDQGGDYALALKGNQETLHQDVQLSVPLAQGDDGAAGSDDQIQTLGKGHGRIELRRYGVIADPAVIAWLQDRHA